MTVRILLKKILLLILIPAGYFILYISSMAPGIVEGLYSKKLYRVLSVPLNAIMGLVPFSVAEILLIATIAFILFKTISLIVKIKKNISKLSHILLNSLITALSTVSIIYFIFVFLWGLNYHRLPFSEIANYNMEPASIEELTAVCRNLSARTNELRNLVQQDSQGVMTLSSNIGGALTRAHKGYKEAGSLIPELAGYYSRPKGVLLSELMSYTGIEGVYFPYTGEANINISIPECEIPFTTCHEMAHQRGFSREDEANYIAYFTCSLHPDDDFRYSGSLMALQYATNALYGYNRDTYTEIRNSLSEGVLRDLNAISKYWQKYESPVQDFSSSVNDTYLKANMQDDGVRSYGRVVDLLIAEQRVN